MPQVLIIGCGFGGLEAARALPDATVDITIVDKTSHHLFRRQRNVTTLPGEVVAVDARPSPLPRARVRAAVGT